MSNVSLPEAWLSVNALLATVVILTDLWAQPCLMPAVFLNNLAADSIPTVTSFSLGALMIHRCDLAGFSSL